MITESEALGVFDAWVLKVRAMSDSQLRDEGFILLGKDQALHELLAQDVPGDAIATALVRVKVAAMAVGDELKLREARSAKAQGLAMH